MRKRLCLRTFTITLRGRYGEHIERFGGLWHARVHEYLYDCIHVHVYAPIYIDTLTYAHTYLHRRREQGAKTRERGKCSVAAITR